MALGTHKVSAVATPGMTAAATARPASGGRNVASVSGAPAEEAVFSSQIGVNDNRLLRHDDDFDLNFSEHREQEPQSGTPFMAKSASGFHAEVAEEAAGGASATMFMDYVVRGVGTYEHNMRVTTPGAVRPGSVMNYLY